MELGQLRCFLAVAEELHFGRAAMALKMLPSALGRQVKLLETELGVALFERTTRSVALTVDGQVLLPEVREILGRVEKLDGIVSERRRVGRSRRLRLGAIDSAAAGLIPGLVHDLHGALPDVSIQLVEEKTVRLLPKILSGALDLALVRPPEHPDRRIEFRHLLLEPAVVALPADHPLATRASLTLEDIADVPLIVPDRRSRPHSHDLTVKTFREAGLVPRIAEIADEKQTILGLVGAELGAAVVPEWTARMSVSGVLFVPLKDVEGRAIRRLPLAAAWLRNARDPLRDEVLAILDRVVASSARPFDRSAGVTRGSPSA